MPGAPSLATGTSTITISGAQVGNVDTQETLGAVAAFTCLDVYTDGSGNYCVDTDLPALPSTTITFTGTVSNGSGGSGNILSISGGFSPSDAYLLSGMVISGTGLTAGTTILTGIGLPNSTGGLTGSLYTLGAITGGTLYTDGAYTNVPLTGGSGSGATANITVALGAVTVVTLVAKGVSYAIGDVLSAAAGNIGGTGSGFSVPVATVSGYTLSTSANLGSRTFTATLPLSFLPHPAPRLTVINCTGSSFVAGMAGAPPEIPAYSYHRKAFAGTTLWQTTFPQGKVPVCGNLLSWEIDVQKPYTGAQGTYVCIIYMFGFKYAGGNYYPTFLSQTINLKTAGIRTVSFTATSGSVAGDTLAAVPFFLTGGHLCTFTGPSAETLDQFPRVVMTAQCDQGIDFAAMSVNNTTSGIDQLADTIPQSAL
jgi:hypothetical protein